MSGEDFELTPPVTGAVKRRPRANGLLPFSGAYNEQHHQWLIDLCARHLTLKEFKRVIGRRNYFADYPELLRATVLYFGVFELGWSARRIQKEKAVNINRATTGRWKEKIEDVRVPGDVFERIEANIRRAKDGFL